MLASSRLGGLVSGLALAICLALPASAQLQMPTPAAPAPRAAPAVPARPAPPPKKTFQREGLASDAVRLEAALKDEAAASGPVRAAKQARDAGEALLANDKADAALKPLTGAVAADPGDPRNWLAYARAASTAAANEENKDYAAKNRLGRRALAAAFRAYQRAAAGQPEGEALAQLARLYADRSEYRDAMETYRASLAASDDSGVREDYEALRAEHGFRILDYKVDSDAASPRVCFTLSEPVAAKADLSPYVAVSGATNAAVMAEGSQVCVDGLKHGSRYAFVLREGLPSNVPGEGLTKASDYEVYVRDRSPQARFTGRNYVLPRTGQAGVPLVSVNAPKLDVEVLRIGDRNLLPSLRSEEFLNQLSGSTARTIAEQKGVRVWKGSLDTAKAEQNQEAVTAFPVLQAVGKLEPGIYVMLAQPSGAASASDEEGGGYEQQATQWFVVSDLGLTAFKGPDGVHVFLRSLAGAQAVSGAEVRLIARNNEVLGTAKTDGKGHAAFAAGLARGEGGIAPGLVVAQLGDDYGFLDLSLSAFDLTDRGVKGRTATGTVEAYVFPERGVYRSGETVQITALLRDAQGVAVPNLPLTLVVKRPDGVEYRRAQLADEGLGGRAFSLPLLSGAMHGTWRIQAFTDPKAPAIGEASFLLEDYVPERLEVNLTPKTPSLAKGEPARIDVAARYLYGAPGAGLEVSGSVTLQAAAAPGIKGLEGFSIGLDDESVEASAKEIESRATTDAKGNATITVPVEASSAPRAMEAKITLAVGEPGGRALSRSLTLPILPDAPVLAIRKGFSGDLQEGGLASFDLVMAAPDGRRLAQAGVVWTLSRIEQNYQWYRADGRWSFEPVKSVRRIADGKADISGDAPARIGAPVTFGQYRLEASVPGRPGAAASVTFQVGWSGGQTADVPDLLELTLDKPAYAAGDTLRARLGSRFKGTATLAVVSDRVHETLDVSVAEGGTTVTLPVKAEWGAGAYLVATAYRPLDQAAKRQPGRALGLAWFSVDRDKRGLGVSVAAPERTRPRRDLTLPVKVAGLASGEEARVTVAMVDVGILNLTRYEAPNPFAHFFGQKALGPEIRDVYGYLIDGMQGTLGAIRSGGDGGGGELADAPPTQAPLALYSGVVKVGPDGTAQVTFPLPAFNGTGRVMVTAWSGSRVGQAQADVIVRDPVVVAGTLPRFLNTGDRSRFLVALDNVEGQAGEYTIDLDLSGPMLVGAGAAHRTVRLEASGKAQVAIPVTAAGPGIARIDLALSGPGLEAGVGQSFRVAVSPGTGALLRRSVRPLEPGATLNLGPDLLADVLPGTGTVSVSASALPGLDVPGLLQALDRYPYGCSEQIVSRAMPLLYVNKLAANDRLALDESADIRIRESIERVLARQDSSGDFGLWSASGANDLWLASYVTDFLTRARERGFAVPQSAMASALDRLRNAVANTTEVRDGGMDLAYAAYVLARNGRPVMGDLRYLSDTKIGDFSTPLGRGQIAAALALLGDRGRAAKTFESALQSLRSGGRDKGSYRADYGSRLRDGAAILALAAETGFTREALQPVAAVLGEEQASGRPSSTQENAWMVLAAQGLTKESETLAFRVDGASEKGQLARSYRGPALDAKPVAIVNEGTAPAQVSVSVAGNPVAPEPAESRGYTIERSYHRIDGSAVDLTRGVRQNERLAVVLKVTEAKASAGRLLLVDRLPAGLEIDNPKLLDADALQGLAFAKSDVQPVHSEFRDDRFVAAFERTPEQSAFFTAAYTVRAVSPGTYVHPGASIEDMYRPERFGRTGFGTLEVTDAK
ncbi:MULTISPECIES: alpha-2-macroglobulin [Methylobacterium]|uniref:Alpha-2-macroglobulin n=8 Tax=Pseudomonadota TaxID=1224 RepID=A0ABQ4SX73_9HYPH|nr:MULTISPECIES: alpha-2-macroglobulin [Methylobacterium]PIU06769.1 MAG: alpha-2-macroglobulin [Methylobacterium sp. CG09_land_8_20_14_0_10_71_15]PIU14873.1 MAG: alpha-2-macroglobulin [Methylobacterium sp. CG08_land_8_20_14_0_20_71_15]GBU17967.1 bacterial alpha2-macroglobulin colonization factor ECAM [Methylobacterium sp.]GJE07462.1 Alpha-2-macroglobulin [Methylobacterium jeotgali]